MNDKATVFRKANFFALQTLYTYSIEKVKKYLTAVRFGYGISVRFIGEEAFSLISDSCFDNMFWLPADLSYTFFNIEKSGAPAERERLLSKYEPLYFEKCGSCFFLDNKLKSFVFTYPIIWKQSVSRKENFGILSAFYKSPKRMTLVEPGKLVEPMKLELALFSEPKNLTVGYSSDYFSIITIEKDSIKTLNSNEDTKVDKNETTESRLGIVSRLLKEGLSGCQNHHKVFELYDIPMSTSYSDISSYTYPASSVEVKRYYSKRTNQPKLIQHMSATVR